MRRRVLPSYSRAIKSKKNKIKVNSVGLTKRFLKASGYAGAAIVTASLAETQQANFEIFTIFTLATGILAAGASCCVIAGLQDRKIREIEFEGDKEDQSETPKGPQ